MFRLEEGLSLICHLQESNGIVYFAFTCMWLLIDFDFDSLGLFTFPVQFIVCLSFVSHVRRLFGNSWELLSALPLICFVTVGNLDRISPFPFGKLEMIPCKCLQ